MAHRDGALDPPAGWPLDPFGVWEAWARSVAEVHAPLSGAVNQAIQASLLDHLGQLGLINITTTRAGDPELERRIVEDVASYGRQLGWVIEGVDALIRAQRGEPPGDDDARALDQVQTLRRDVDALKARAAAARLEGLVDDIHELRRDPEANAAAIAALRAALGDDQ
jgi:hypothetical protein